MANWACLALCKGAAQGCGIRELHLIPRLVQQLWVQLSYVLLRVFSVIAFYPWAPPHSQTRPAASSLTPLRVAQGLFCHHVPCCFNAAPIYKCTRSISKLVSFVTSLLIIICHNYALPAWLHHASWSSSTNGHPLSIGELPFFKVNLLGVMVNTSARCFAVKFLVYIVLKSWKMWDHDFNAFLACM